MNPAIELNTLFVGRNLLSFETLDSANSYALSLLAGAKKVPEGTVILAAEQKSGRGQAFTQWYSDKGKNLLLSIILYPNFLSPANIFHLSQCISLGVYDTMKELLGEGIHIKWPNDIYFGNKKISGLLIENSVRSLHINYSVVGIGINVNQDIFPDSLPNPVSIKNILGTDIDLTSLMNSLYNHIENRYLLLKGGKFQDMKSDYLHVLYRYNEYHWFEYGGQRFKAKIKDVGDEGKLVLEYGNNLTGRYDFKTIHFVLNDDSD